VWRSSTSGRSTGSSYGVELASTVAMRICVVPDYKRGEGNFLINDLAYLPSEDMLPVVKEEDVSHSAGQYSGVPLHGHVVCR
jgi:hypothetical protein